MQVLDQEGSTAPKGILYYRRVLKDN